jgi:hypothetical protein
LSASGVMEARVGGFGYNDGSRRSAVAGEHGGPVIMATVDPVNLASLLDDALEGPHPQQILLQRANEPLGTAIAFRGADEGGLITHAAVSDICPSSLSSRLVHGRMPPRVHRSFGAG